MCNTLIKLDKITDNYNNKGNVTPWEDHMICNIEEILSPTPHELRWKLQEAGLTLWQVRKALGGAPSEFKLSRYLTGIDPMPGDLEKKLHELIVHIKTIQGRQ
jgi:hypothetical protein